MAMFNEDNLPDGLCDEIFDEIKLCSSNFATVWAVGGDIVSSTNSIITNQLFLFR